MVLKCKNPHCKRESETKEQARLPALWRANKYKTEQHPGLLASWRSKLNHTSNFECAELNTSHRPRISREWKEWGWEKEDPWRLGHPHRDARASQPVPPLPTVSSCHRKGEGKSVGCLGSHVVAGLLWIEQPQFAKDQVVLLWWHLVGLFRE